MRKKIVLNNIITMVESDADHHQGTKLHKAMFPWLAFGHIIPFFQLSKLIAQKGHQISFISTPRNIDRLPKLPPTLASSIQLIKLPLPRIENLPEHAQATIDLPYDKLVYLKNSLRRSSRITAQLPSNIVSRFGSSRFRRLLATSVSS